MRHWSAMIFLVWKHVNEEENKAVKWWSFEDALNASSEPWMIERVYKKLLEKCSQILPPKL